MTSIAPDPPAPPSLAGSTMGQGIDITPDPSVIAALGAGALNIIQIVKDIYSVFVRTLYYCARGRREPGAVVQYMYEIGNRSVFFLTVVMGFIGMIFVYQTGLQTRRLLPELSLLGANYLELLFR